MVKKKKKEVACVEVCKGERSRTAKEKRNHRVNKYEYGGGG